MSYAHNCLYQQQPSKLIKRYRFPSTATINQLVPFQGVARLAERKHPLAMCSLSASDLPIALLNSSPKKWQNNKGWSPGVVHPPEHTHYQEQGPEFKFHPHLQAGSFEWWSGETGVCLSLLLPLHTSVGEKKIKERKKKKRKMTVWSGELVCRHQGPVITLMAESTGTDA